MKNLLVALMCFVVGGATVLAQDDDILVGVGLGYGGDVEELGISVHGAMALSEKLSVAADFRYFLVEDPLTFWALNANVHYLVLENSSVDVFVLGGLNYSTMDIGDIDLGVFGTVSGASSSEIGINLGAGANVSLDGILLRPEAKIVTGDVGQFVASVAVLFPI